VFLGRDSSVKNMPPACFLGRTSGVPKKELKHFVSALFSCLYKAGDQGSPLPCAESFLVSVGASRARPPAGNLLVCHSEQSEESFIRH
jgi:hypothetical protein